MLIKKIPALSFLSGLPKCVIICVSLLACFFAPSAPDSSPALAGIAHVAFRVADVPGSREFYRALGFEQSFEFADPGKPPVAYIKVNDRQFIELYGRANESQPLGLLHVCYEAAGIQSLWNEYVKRGLNPPAPRKARAGNLLFLLHDPEHQIVEYTQYLPGSLHFADRGKHLGDRRISQRLIRAVFPVSDLPAERLFYTAKLAFVGAQNGRELLLPGDSGESVELEQASPVAKPQIFFAVANLDRAAAELRSRALAVHVAPGSVSVVDPDGAVILFVPQRVE